MAVPSRQGLDGKRSRLPSNFTQLPWDPANPPAQPSTNNQPPPEDGNDQENENDIAVPAQGSRAAAPSPPPSRVYPANPYLVRHNPAIANAAVRGPARAHLARGTPQLTVGNTEVTPETAAIPVVNSPSSANELRSATPSPPPVRAYPANPYLARLHPEIAATTPGDAAVPTPPRREMPRSRLLPPRGALPGDMGPPPVPRRRGAGAVLDDLATQILDRGSREAAFVEPTMARETRGGGTEPTPEECRREVQRVVNAIMNGPGLQGRDLRIMNDDLTEAERAELDAPVVIAEYSLRYPNIRVNPNVNRSGPPIGTAFAGQPRARRPVWNEVQRDPIIEEMDRSSMPYPNAAPRFPLAPRPGHPLPAMHVGEESDRALTRSPLAEALDMPVNWRDQVATASSPAAETEQSPLFVTPGPEDAAFLRRQLQPSSKSRSTSKSTFSSTNEAVAPPKRGTKRKNNSKSPSSPMPPPPLRRRGTMASPNAATASTPTQTSPVQHSRPLGRVALFDKIMAFDNAPDEAPTKEGTEDQDKSSGGEKDNGDKSAE